MKGLFVMCRGRFAPMGVWLNQHLSKISDPDVPTARVYATANMLRST